MSAVKGTSSFNISFTQLGSLGVAVAEDLPAAVLNLASSFLTPGSLADQCSLIHADTYTFAASTPQTIDLQSLLDILGATISFSVVRFFAYRIQSTNDAHKILGGGAGSNEWNGFLTSGAKMTWFPSSAKNSGFHILQAPNTTGIPVGSGSRLWKMDPGSNAVGDVDLIIAGS